MAALELPRLCMILPIAITVFRVLAPVSFMCLVKEPCASRVTPRYLRVFPTSTGCPSILSCESLVICQRINRLASMFPRARLQAMLRHPVFGSSQSPLELLQGTS